MSVTDERQLTAWKGEFGGTPKKSHQEKIEAHGISITLVDFSGVAVAKAPRSERLHRVPAALRRNTCDQRTASTVNRQQTFRMPHNL
jgi:hypothetical protein